MSDRHVEPGLREQVGREIAKPPRSWDGPYLLLVPITLAVATVWWIRQPEILLVPSRPPARVDLESTHDVLGGETTLGGATLAFWLAPFEPDADRQAFQAQALRKRYDLDEGQPWRLRLEWRAIGEAEIGEAGPTLDVSRLRIVDSAGVALAPRIDRRELDPLATLLAPPAEPLRIGTSLDLFLWGRAPLDGARLVGAGDESIGEAPFEVSMTSRPLRLGDWVGPMARLDPAAPSASSKSEGKRPGSAASAVPPRGRDDARY